MSNGLHRPDGQITSVYRKWCQALETKIFRLTRRANHFYNFARLTRQGALRTSRTRGGMRWTRQRRARKGSQGGLISVSDYPARERTALPTVFDETGRIGTRFGQSFGETGADGEMVWFRRPQAGVKSCGDAFGPTGLACIVNPQGDGGKVQGSPRRSPISRNTSRRESRDDPVHLWSTRALHVHDRGCNRRPAFPAPSCIRGREAAANLGRTAPRERGRMFARCLKLNQ